MGKESFYYESRDGQHRIHALRFTPEDGKIKGVIQIIHGMAEHIGCYETVAEFFAGQGFVVTGNDHLGHGLSVGEDKAYGYICEQDPATVVVRDVHRLKKMTQNLYPDVPYIMLGHSMGSFILRNYLFRYGAGIDGAIIMGTGGQSEALNSSSRLVVSIQKIIEGPRHPSKPLEKMSFGHYLRKIKPLRTPVDWICKNPARVDAYLADPLCGFTFTVNGFEMMTKLIQRMQDPENIRRVPRKLPLLFLSGSEDPVGDYGKGVTRAYQSYLNAGMTDVTMKIYPGDRHELFHEEDGDQVRADILDWIHERFQ